MDHLIVVDVDRTLGQFVGEGRCTVGVLAAWRRIRATLARGVSPAVSRSVRVVPGELGARAEALGAVALANRSTNAHLTIVE